MEPNDPKDYSQEIGRLFAQVRQLPWEPSPYLSRRVLAEVRDRKSPRRGPRLGWVWGGSLAGAVVGALLMYFALSGAPFEMKAASPFAVKIDVQPFESLAVAKARIELPDGIEFVAQGYPELRETKSLTLIWSRTEGPSLTFVVQGTRTGTHTVKVAFLDSQGKVVAERLLRIRVRGSVRGA